MSLAIVGLTAAATSATINLDDLIAEEIYVQVTGPFVGTLVPEASLDGVNYDTVQLQPIAGGAAVTSITAPGSWVPTPAIKVFGARFFRMRMSAYTSGTALVNISTTATARA